MCNNCLLCIQNIVSTIIRFLYNIFKVNVMKLKIVPNTRSPEDLILYDNLFDSIRFVNSYCSTDKIKPRDAYQNVAKVLDGFSIYLPSKLHTIIEYSLKTDHEGNQYTHFLQMNIVRKHFKLQKEIVLSKLYKKDKVKTIDDAIDYHINIPRQEMNFIDFKGCLAISGVLNNDNFMFKGEQLDAEEYNNQPYVIVLPKTPTTFGYAKNPDNNRFIIEK